MAGARRVHAAVGVHGVLVVRRGGILVCLHRVRALLHGSLSLSLCCLSSLLAEFGSLLLLLCARCRCAVERARFKIHRWYEWTGVLLLSNEWVQLRLLRRPPLQRADGQQATNEIDESYTVVHFCNTPMSVFCQARASAVVACDLPRSISLCFMFFRGIGYDLMISGRVLAWKYFLLGCSLVPRSLEYCSMLFK